MLDPELMHEEVRADRYNTGKRKITMMLEAAHAIEGVTAVLEFGAQKYERSNWQKGLPYTELLDSMMRHSLAFLRGEDYDPESGLPHVDHILCNALFLADMLRTHPELDDRSVK